MLKFLTEYPPSKSRLKKKISEDTYSRIFKCSDIIQKLVIPHLSSKKLNDTQGRDCVITDKNICLFL